MRRFLLSLMHLDLVRELGHELGTGRALENARREREEVEQTLAIIDALAGRLEPVSPARRPVAA
jgi:hypothetical protein